MYTESQVIRTEIEFTEKLHSLGLSTIDLETSMALLNACFYRLARNLEAVTRNENYQLRFIPERIPALLATIKSGTSRVCLVTSWLIGHVQEWWEGSYYGRQKLNEFMELLAHKFGLFKLIPGEKGKRRSPVFEQIDVERSLILAEVMEKEFVRRTGEELGHKAVDKPIVGGGDVTDQILEGLDVASDDFAGLPEHRGYFTTMLFNLVFNGVAKYRRARQSLGLSVQVCEVEEEEAIVLAEDDYKDVPLSEMHLMPIAKATDEEDFTCEPSSDQVDEPIISDDFDYGWGDDEPVTGEEAIAPNEESQVDDSEVFYDYDDNEIVVAQDEKTSNPLFGKAFAILKAECEKVAAIFTGDHTTPKQSSQPEPTIVVVTDEQKAIKDGLFPPNWNELSDIEKGMYLPF